jgi:hypothetical protein
MLYFGLRSPKVEPRPEPVPMTDEERRIQNEKLIAWGRRLIEEEKRAQRGEPAPHNPYAVLAAIQIMQQPSRGTTDDLFAGAAGTVLGTATTVGLLGLGMSLMDD